MFELATLTGNKVDAAYAIKSVTNIMGQLNSTSHQSHNNQSSHYPNNTKKFHSSNSSSKNSSYKIPSYHRHSTVQPTPPPKVTKTEQIYNDEQLNQQLLRVKNEPIKGSATLPQTNSDSNDTIVNTPSERPTTICEIGSHRHHITNISSNNNNNNNNNNNINNNQLQREVLQKNRTNQEIHQEFASNEFFKSGEGYHKTEICYYKTKDGGYHKLPKDSYHKMTEGCYMKLADGSFRRLNELSNNYKNATIDGGSSEVAHIRVKNNVMRFLKRSKSHTPSTMRQLQKEKEKIAAAANHNNSGVENQQQNVSSSSATKSQQQPNRRVMVTMIDGGLPVVATSKHPEKTTSSKQAKDNRSRSGGSGSDSNKNRNSMKVITEIIIIDDIKYYLAVV